MAASLVQNGSEFFSEDLPALQAPQDQRTNKEESNETRNHETINTAHNFQDYLATEHNPHLCHHHKKCKCGLAFPVILPDSEIFKSPPASKEKQKEKDNHVHGGRLSKVPAGVPEHLRKTLAPVVGISGVTCGGKTTLATSLEEHFGHCIVINQDDYYYPQDDDHHQLVSGYTFKNYDVITAIDMDKMMQDVYRALHVRREQGTPILIEGFLVFASRYLGNLCDKEYFLQLEKSTCMSRREKRLYDTPDAEGYFDLCVWPMYEEYLKFVKETYCDVVYIDGEMSVQQIFDMVKVDIGRRQ